MNLKKASRKSSRFLVFEHKTLTGRVPIQLSNMLIALKPGTCHDRNQGELKLGFFLFRFNDVEKPKLCTGIKNKKQKLNQNPKPAS